MFRVRQRPLAAHVASGPQSDQFSPAARRASRSPPGPLRHARRDEGVEQAPAWTQPSIKHVEAGRRRCPQHRDYPADNCAQHLKDAEIAALEAQTDRLEPSHTGPTMSPREAMALARANAMKAKTGNGTLKPKMRHEPDPENVGPMPELFGAVAGRITSMVGGDRA